MITSINRIAQELQAIATAHLQLQSFYYGDIVQTYNSLEGVKHSTLLCDIKNSTVYDGYSTVTIELMVLDRVLTHDVEVKNQPQQDVESDTLQVINDLYWIIRYSPRWQAFGMVEEGSAARKVVENTPDKVTGWFISINLRIRNQQGICDLPMIGYDYGTIVAPANCPGVTIIRDGQVIEIVDSGGTFSFTTGGDPCEIIGEATAQEIVDCLDPAQLEPLQDLICEPLPPCDPAIVNIEGIEVAVITDPCGSVTDLRCNTPTNAILVSGAASDVNGLYTLGSGEVNGKIWWENTDADAVLIYTGLIWRIEGSDGSPRYYGEDGAEWPWDGSWRILQGLFPPPIVTQATIGDICPCDPVDVKINDVSFSTVPSGGELDIDVVNTANDPLGSEIGGQWVIEDTEIILEIDGVVEFSQVIATGTNEDIIINL